MLFYGLIKSVLIFVVLNGKTNKMENHLEGSVAPVSLSGNRWVMPGMATAHSHAFQRVLRGRTQRRATEADSFWSWRGLMYKLVEQLDPDDMYHIARFAYTELAMSGVTAVGEFHYVHHDQTGRPYAQRTELAEAVIRAALDTGIRICLIRTAYMRGGHHRTLETAQRRFFDPSTDLILQDVDHLKKQFEENPMVSVAVAAHSIRAVPITAIQELAACAATYDMPFHMHVCEQRRELDECIEEYGATPISLLADHGILSPGFVGVHATHLTDTEINTLGETRSMVCICRTTERDLGDGLPPISDLIQAGARLCVGVDSHACENAFEEMRAVEFDERSRLESRHAVAEASVLLDAATRVGYAACDLEGCRHEDRVTLKVDDPSIVGIDESSGGDAIVFNATPRAVDEVIVNGKSIVNDGVHEQYKTTCHHYLGVLRKLSLMP